MVASSDPRWLQWAFTTLVGLFDQVGLNTNTGKTNTLLLVGRVLHERIQGREGRDTGQPAVTHHLQCGGGCSGLSLGHAGSGGGRDAGGAGAGGQAPSRPLLRGQRHGSVVRPPLATVGVYYSSRIV